MEILCEERAGCQFIQHMTMWVLAGKEEIIQIKQKTDVKIRYISALCKDYNSAAKKKMGE